MVLIPDDRKMLRHIKVNSPLPKDAEVGMKVLVKMHAWKDVNEMPEGDVVQVIGKAGLHDTEMQAIIIAQGFEAGFPAQVEGQANALREGKDAFIESQIPHRRDMRKTITYTIDPADAKDFDDAISFKKLDNGHYEVGIHIADVSYYVRPGMALDEEAIARETSVYLVDRVIPMLPEVLSNDLCSLVQGEDRLVMSAVFELDGEGVVHGEWYGRSLINSHRRYSYEDAQTTLDTKQGDFYEELNILNTIAKKMQQVRFASGALVLETEEVKFKLDEKGVPVDVYVKERGDTHKLIEECMIAANVEAARYLLSRHVPAPYRIHEKPPETKYADLLEFLKEFKLSLPPWSKVRPGDYTKLLKKIRDRPDATLLESVLLRSQSLAIYSPENHGHFGLALEAYAHFTSPIRRYPDLLVHRAIKHALSGKPLDKFTYNAREMAALALQCSERERRADEAEREVDERYRAAWMEKHVGGQFDGVISGVTSFGLFVELDESKVQGLVHVTQLPQDYYKFDATRKTLTGERRGSSYRLGDRVRILVLKASMEERKIDFRLVEHKGEDEGDGLPPLPERGKPAKRTKKQY